MEKIESKVGKILSSDKKIFTFFSDFNNFEQLIPADKVKNWLSDGESCSFSVDGIGSVGLRIIEKEEFKLIKISSEGKSPVPFQMWIQMKQIEENDTRVKITIDPKVNVMLMGMVKKPLKEFSDMLIDRMEQLSF
ncbi:MAG: SRPBCC family protein [Bacteroidales bacterium]|nr:SRPBCC family protein [Bacteroidales bacterium]MCF8390245.1 SRPBCC family protein [Bacteroidales bacterium]